MLKLSRRDIAIKLVFLGSVVSNLLQGLLIVLWQHEELEADLLCIAELQYAICGISFLNPALSAGHRALW